jgi:hypothetical protein
VKIMSNRTYSIEEIRDLERSAWSEQQFQEQVIQVANGLGYLIAHFRKVRIQRQGGGFYYATPVQADGKGFVDLTCAGKRMLYLELKVKNKRLTPEQVLWRDAILRAEGLWFSFKPAQWDELVKTLELYSPWK